MKNLNNQEREHAVVFCTIEPLIQAVCEGGWTNWVKRGQIISMGLESFNSDRRRGITRVTKSDLEWMVDHDTHYQMQCWFLQRAPLNFSDSRKVTVGEALNEILAFTTRIVYMNMIPFTSDSDTRFKIRDMATRALIKAVRYAADKSRE